MQVTQIPFVQHTGINKFTEHNLELQNRETVHNHLGTIHAGALFALAESQSGLCLQQLFPELEGKVVPVLRASTLKYKKPVTEGVYAVSDVNTEEKARFETTFLKKGRGSIVVSVVLKDGDGTVCVSGDFTWFVQKVS